MKKLLIGVIMMLSLTGCVSNMFQVPKDWSTRHTVQQGIFLGTLTTDVVQLKHMTYPEYEEQNSCLGKNPSNQKVNNYNIVTALLNTYIAKELPDGLRDIFQYISIGVELEAINNNRNVRRKH